MDKLGINIDIVEGYYTLISGLKCAHYVEVDPMEMELDLDELKQSAEDPTQLLDKIEAFRNRYHDFVSDDIKININFVEETDIAATTEEAENTDVGYIYLRVHTKDLDALRCAGTIYFRLMAPQGKLLCLTISPDRFVDSIEDIADTITEVNENTEVRYLICYPHPVDPGDIMVVPYLMSGTINCAAFNCSNPDLGNIYV